MVGEKAVATVERTASADLVGARQAVRELVDSPHFDVLLGSPDARLPVMVLDAETRAAVGAGSSVVILSGETLAKQRRHHPEIGPAEYRRLPDIGAQPDLIYQQDEQRLHFLRQDDGRWLKAVTKVTEDGSETYVVSLAYAGKDERRRIARRFPLLFGQLAGALAAFFLEADESDANGDGEAA